MKYISGSFHDNVGVLCTVKYEDDDEEKQVSEAEISKSGQINSVNLPFNLRPQF